MRAFRSFEYTGKQFFADPVIIGKSQKNLADPVSHAQFFPSKPQLFFHKLACGDVSQIPRQRLKPAGIVIQG
ncbi:MAG: hypothetical protein A4E66_02228 [Syntrophus sp. PtaB.Bin001]|nr:MAG: hypothetical protein A4E66_02228 [Syntrophus sp. PtaB.Bin001]